jgi:signal transduction histidine kinase
LNKVIETTVTVARNEWKYVAEMKLELDRNLPRVPCYVGDFNQAMLNLIVNAAHAIGEVVGPQPDHKGVITIRTREEGGEVEVRVSDTGAGIPEAIRPRIFEPFFTTKPVGKGTGQGLPIAYASIVKKHRGKLSFESEVGKGTTFIIRLPIAASAADTPPPKTAAVGAASREAAVAESGVIGG